MRHLLTEAQTRAVEAAAVAAGVSSAELMGLAGAAVAVKVMEVMPEGRVVVAAGAGSNGGDGWVAAHVLHTSGRDVVVLTSAGPDDMSSPAREAVRDAIESGVQWLRVADGADVAGPFAEAAVIIDALLGIGMHGVPRAPYADFIREMNEAGAVIVSVDLPSGVDCDTGSALGAAVQADHTITFFGPKVGSVLQPGAALAGVLSVADLGLPMRAGADAGSIELWDEDDYAHCFPHPHWDDRKGTRGRLLIIGGQPGLTGAVCLAADASLRSGAGYVSVAVPAPSLPVVEVKLTAPVKCALPATADGALLPEAVDVVLDAATRADAVVLGPGLGRAESTCEVVRRLVARVEVPLLIDADALYALGDDLSGVAARIAPTVLTPHSAEAARLLSTTPEAIDADRPCAVTALAAGRATAVLKGPATLIAEGGRVVVNPTGGPGLATLGTGDVLSGVIGAMLARGMLALDAAVLGTYLHGASGDAASEDLTAVCCTAEDVVAYLPEAVGPLL